MRKGDKIQVRGETGRVLDGIVESRHRRYVVVLTEVGYRTTVRVDRRGRVVE